MVDLPVDRAALQRFEDLFNPLQPETGPLPAKVLGYGEISTVLAIDSLSPHLAFKRMAMFETESEAAAYTALYAEAMAVLTEVVGLQTVPGALIQIRGVNGRPIIYLVQPKLNPQAIASRAMHLLAAADQVRLFTAVLHEICRVFSFNQAQSGLVALGLDGQMSNWVVRDFAGATLPEPIILEFLDTSSPLVQKNGVEQLDAELFLRSAPAFLRWLLRWLFLQDVVTRYYNARKVSIDLLGNLYKEQLPDLVPAFVTIANQILQEQFPQVEPITVKDVAAYYREDAMIWRVYLTFRRLDRWLHRLFRKPYPYVLPGHIKR